MGAKPWTRAPLAAASVVLLLVLGGCLGVPWGGEPQPVREPDGAPQDGINRSAVEHRREGDGVGLEPLGPADFRALVAEQVRESRLVLSALKPDSGALQLSRARDVLAENREELNATVPPEGLQGLRDEALQANRLAVDGVEAQLQCQDGRNLAGCLVARQLQERAVAALDAVKA